MGNFRSRREGGIFDPDEVEITEEEAKKRIQDKLDANTLVKDSLRKMGKNGTDLGLPDGLLNNFLTLADAMTYREPTVEEVIAYENQMGTEREEEEFETNMAKMPSATGYFESTASGESHHVQSIQPSKSTSMGGSSNNLGRSGKLKEARLKVKLVITELPDNSTSRKILSPVLSTLRLAPQFGLFHSALIIGPWKIEWNNSSLIVPRKCMASAVIAFDVMEVVGEENIKQKLAILADGIAEYNVMKSYDQMNCNCQQFVDDICKRLGLELKFKGQMAEFMDKLRKTGRCESKYQIPDHILEKMRQKKVTFNTMPNFDIMQTSGEITFTSHEQLDEVVNAIVTADATFLYSTGKDDHKLLKAYDRAFWLRHFKYKVEKKGAVNDEYKPLGYDPTSKETLCPFQDPTITATAWKH